MTIEFEMKRSIRMNYSIASFWAPMALLLLSAASAHAGAGAVTARVQPVAAQYRAFAQVAPIAVLPLRAQQAGVVTGMQVLAGESLKAGQNIGVLGGPEIQALFVQDDADFASALARLDAARKSLAFQRRQRRLQLTTKLAVFQAESALAQARSALEIAQANLRALRQTIVLRAPIDGRVLAVDAANGERMAVGQPVLVLQPVHRLWLQAVYYGADASMVHAGMTGRFVPADGSHPVPVRVSSIFAMLAPDGGEGVGLTAMGPAPVWRNGEFGRLTLNGPVRSLVAVPTRALILDRGKWWVMVRTKTGDHPQQVIPGPTRGWRTCIVHGLAPGSKVVVDKPYLEFHRSIARRYQLPD